MMMITAAVVYVACVTVNSENVVQTSPVLYSIVVVVVAWSGIFQFQSVCVCVLCAVGRLNVYWLVCRRSQQHEKNSTQYKCWEMNEISQTGRNWMPNRMKIHRFFTLFSVVLFWRAKHFKCLRTNPNDIDDMEFQMHYVVLAQWMPQSFWWSIKHHSCLISVRFDRRTHGCGWGLWTIFHFFFPTSLRIVRCFRYWPNCPVRNWSQVSVDSQSKKKNKNQIDPCSLRVGVSSAQWSNALQCA